MRAQVLRVVAWIARLFRAVRDLPRMVARWLRSHAAACVASVWLSGMSVFGMVTVRRVVAAQVAEAPTSTHQRSDGAVERVAMLDVDEINGIRIQRLHALGLAAAGDTEAPDERTIQEARAVRAHGIVLDGEQVATAGKIAVVTRGGIAGWLKRNRGKKADPETLAWLRGQEAAEGGAAYAGWADRDDASILNWAREQRRSGAVPAASNAEVSVDAATSPTIQGLDLIGLGGAAVAALRPQAAADPGAGEIATLSDRLERLIATGAVTISIRDHRIVLALVCDRLFEHNQPELTLEGARIVRELGRVLAGDRGHAYNVVVDRERAFELVSNLAIAGLAPERIDIALKEVDRAIDLVDVEWIAVKETP